MYCSMSWHWHAVDLVDLDLDLPDFIIHPSIYLSIYPDPIRSETGVG